METTKLLSSLFPGPNVTFNGRGGREVNGLAKNTVPQNCEILHSGLYHSALSGRQEYYLVRAEGVLVYLRVCTAMEGSGYDEFAVIYDIAVSEESQRQLEVYARSSIAAICRPREVH